MTRKMLMPLFAGALLTLLCALPGPAHAQTLIEALRDQGYSQIKILKQTFSRINFEACQDGVRYLVKMRAVGTVRSKTKIGECRRAISEQRATRILRDRGFRRIELQAVERGFAGRACRQGERFEVFVNRFGDMRRPQAIGPCRRPALSIEQVRRKLRDEGYNRITFTDKELPRYVAEACRNERRLELTLSRRGEIRDRRRIGRCAPPIDPRDIARVLRDKGFGRIKVIDNELPRYVAEACRRGDRMEIVLNRYGEIRNEREIGKCRRPINPDQISKILRDRGYNRVQVVDDRLPRYVAEACRDDDRIEVALNRFGGIVDELRIGGCAPALSPRQFLKVLRDRGYSRIRYRGQDGSDYLVRACFKTKRYRARFSQYGEVVVRRPAGPCVTPSLDTLAERFRNRGVERLSFFVEGCRNGVRYRTRIDAFGDPVDRKRIGKCN